MTETQFRRELEAVTWKPRETKLKQKAVRIGGGCGWMRHSPDIRINFQISQEKRRL
jgi:hypothetical protein